MTPALVRRAVREACVTATPITPLLRVASPLVTVRGLMKSFGHRRVLDGVDLDITRGAVTAIIGPNGAGKTTLNKVLLGLVHADAGRMAFDGVEVAGQIAYRARIGYMPQAARFPERYTGQDVLDLLRDLRGETTPRSARSRADSVSGSTPSRHFSSRPTCCCSTNPPQGSIRSPAAS